MGVQSKKLIFGKLAASPKTRLNLNVIFLQDKHFENSLYFPCVLETSIGILSQLCWTILLKSVYLLIDLKYTRNHEKLEFQIKCASIGYQYFLLKFCMKGCYIDDNK